MLTKEELLTLLEREVVPALGCTEPVCVALCAADAYHAIGGQIVSIKVAVNANIFKNGLSVGIPGCPHVGLNYAAALGACLGNPEKGLELFSAITETTNVFVEEMIAQNRVTISIQKEETGLYVNAEVITTNGIGISTIRDSHANIVFTKANDTILVQKGRSAATVEQSDLYEKLKGSTIAQLRRLVEELPATALKPMMDGVKMNGNLADYGLEHDVGVGIGHALRRLTDSEVFGKSLLSRVMLRTAACAESRMSGCPYAVMSSAGSGNHGITAILPVVEVAREHGTSDETLARALALSHISTLYIKQYLGRLSSICGCGMAAATGAAVAITWLLGGTDEQLGYAVTNMAANLSGMICDGGKVGCALKLATAASAALMSAYLAVDGVVVSATDGVVGATAEESVANMGLISHPGMTETDRVILKIMLEKQNRALLNG
nr:L-serine ammonia-lyase, iron-sulfur-dependent, subunit alpha [uncultured Flavonifractor sp.]